MNCKFPTGVAITLVQLIYVLLSKHCANADRKWPRIYNHVFATQFLLKPSEFILRMWAVIQFCCKYKNESNEAARTAFVKRMFVLEMTGNKFLTSDLAFDPSDYLASHGELEAEIQILPHVLMSQRSVRRRCGRVATKWRRELIRCEAHEFMTMLLELFWCHARTQYCCC